MKHQHEEEIGGKIHYLMDKSDRTNRIKKKNYHELSMSPNNRGEIFLHEMTSQQDSSLETSLRSSLLTAPTLSKTEAKCLSL